MRRALAALALASSLAVPVTGTPTVPSPPRPAAARPVLVAVAPSRPPAPPRSKPSAASRTRPIKRAYSRAEVLAILRWAAERRGVNYGGLVGLCSCESGLDPANFNYCCHGLGGQHELYWRDRAKLYGHEGASYYDPWANADVTAAMVGPNEAGLSHFDCASAFLSHKT